MLTTLLFAWLSLSATMCTVSVLSPAVDYYLDGFEDGTLTRRLIALGYFPALSLLLLGMMLFAEKGYERDHFKGALAELASTAFWK